ncbi:glycoside hydrolase family 130 protein [Muricauda ruestringensis]|uniref:glycoside hydrolase family 130 protein n=1 Tax=Flagellimonas ruestringensis TaxID=111501 RepID=UPI001CD4B33F|nr:glycoside hydrolase family 130 protein [Allomuricauda ruestringensis]MCA0957414.1 glycoside hydrolase family 130 protein [Allomuricauda ruestringensis]
MKNIVARCGQNPLLSPIDLKPSQPEMIIECLLNPGIFEYKGKIGMVLRVAERTTQKEGMVSVPMYDGNGQLKILDFSMDDPKLDHSDARVITYDGEQYLTTISHLRILFSKDGVTFEESDEFPPLFGQGDYESYGIEDCRVSKIAQDYYLTYTMVSPNGVGVGLKTTSDWKSFMSHGMIFSPHNKDCAIFEETIDETYYAFHRPSSPELGGNYMWISESKDGFHWGNHKCIARTRPNKFDSARLGAGAAPIKTERGWLAIYHGADEQHRYCLGALLLDLNNPSKVLARSAEPIMMPEEAYEKVGFFGEVIFTNGHVVDGDDIHMYYGASDEHVALATLSLSEILKTLD